MYMCKVIKCEIECYDNLLVENSRILLFEHYRISGKESVEKIDNTTISPCSNTNSFLKEIFLHYRIIILSGIT